MTAFRWAAFAVACSMSAPAAGADGDSQSPLFQTDAPLALELRAPFPELSRKRGAERPYHPAVLSYTATDGEATEIALEVRVRGKSRARPEACEFPPLLLNFRAPETAGTLFEGENKLKLVTHCNRESAYEEYVLLEYLNYRVWNLFSALGLRARLAEITYVDAGRRRVVAIKPGFLLEDEDRFAQRAGVELIEAQSIERGRYDPTQLALVGVFEYFIGNTDWSAFGAVAGESCCHNVIPVLRSDGVAVPVPYDFDSTGVVDPPYAAPSESLRIKTVRERLYRGLCGSNEWLPATFALFQDRRAAIFALYEQQAGLSSNSVADTKRYYETFYATIADENKVRKEFLRKCRD